MRLATEINDFIRGWKAVDGIVGSRDDKEYKRLRNQALQQKLNSEPELQNAKLKYYGLKQNNISAATDLIRGRLKKLNAPTPTPTPTPTDSIPAYPLPSYSNPTSAVPVETAPGKQSGDTYVPGDMSALGEDEINDSPSYFAASGGAIDGDEDDTPSGQMAVPDGDEDDMGGAPETGAEMGDEMGVQVADASSATTPGFSYQAAHDAVRDGLQYQVAQLQQRTGAVDAGSYHRTRRSVTADAIDPRQMEAVFKSIDPQGKMSVGERGMAAFGHVYSYLLSKGDIQGAQKAASGMLNYYNIQSNKWRAMSRAAAENGDLNGTIKALVRSYENIPDGMDINVVKQGDKLGFEFKDAQSGKTMRKFVASPDEILNAATHGTLPSFEDLIVQSAGRRYQASQGRGARTKGAGVPSIRDRTAAATAVDEEAQAQDTVNGEVKPRYALPQGNEAGVKDIASNIFRSNDVSQHDAMRVATGLVDPTKPNDMLTPTEDGGAVVKLGDGREIKLSRNAFLQAVAIRGKTVGKVTVDKKVADEKAVTEKADYETQKKAFENLNAKAKAARAAESQAMGRRSRYTPGAVPDWASQDEK